VNLNNKITPVILLVDNGSVRADATKQLRKLAQELGGVAGAKIHPVSLRHADRIPANLLDGELALVFNNFMDEYLLQGWRKFIILPLFFAKGRAVTALIADHLLSLQAVYADFTFHIADVIYPLPDGEPLLANIIYDQILNTAQKHKFSKKNIVLVDHGSPQKHVTKVRKHLVQAVQDKLPKATELEQAAMERRQGDKYLFNGELLQDWLVGKAKTGEKTAIVCLLFFLAGRHAGEGGDIDKICKRVMNNYPDFKIAVSPLIAEHKELVSILLARLQTAQQQISIRSETV
jgi:sirohydrochlorin ferrochelatase